MRDENRTMVELAAKAAGIDGEWDSLDEFNLKGARTPDNDATWDPFNRDGDALRLAVKLELQMRLRHSENEVSIYGAPNGRIDEGVHGDPYAATRRAIVRAAAEIGKSMKP